MTPFGDLLRDCAIALRADLERWPDATEVSLKFDNGTTLTYVRGEGLVVMAGGHRLMVPEEALLEERWMVADGV